MDKYDVVLRLTAVEARELAMALEDHLTCLADKIREHGPGDERSLWRHVQLGVLEPVNLRLEALAWPDPEKGAQSA